jgi:POT family proton-dependent oligopeptide transporter
MGMESAKKERELLGHPIGLTYLFTTEMAERFSYYGMTAILVFYLTGQLLLSSHAEHVIGYRAIKDVFESVLGPLSVEKFASDITGLYTGLVYLTPLFGGMLADRVWGQRYSVAIGGALMAAGEFMLTQDSLFFFGLLFLIIGNGGFKPNISTQVGNLYQAGDSRIDRAYSIFYVGINIGATFSPFICGTLGEKVGWHWGFFAAGVGVSLGVLVYLFALRSLPADRITKARRAGQTIAPAKLTAQDWKAILSLATISLPVALFWAAYAQQYISIELWARDFTNRMFLPGIFDFDIPATWSQSINPAMIFAFTPLVIVYWTRQARLGREPTTVAKMAVGCLLEALSFVLMAGVAWITGPHGHAHWLWLIVFFVPYTIAELFVSPIGLALVARVAPQQILSLMMGLWFVAVFFGNTIGGYVGSLWDDMSKPQFFLITAAIPGLASVFIWLFDRPLRPILERKSMKIEMQPGPDMATEERAAV